MNKNGYIGVIDSGLGEISVLLKLIKYFPNGKFVCFADTKNNPYGTKDKKTIINLISVRKTVIIIDIKDAQHFKKTKYNVNCR